MKGEICYTVLGGGQEIGASCHCLAFGKNRILLDCGMGLRDGVLYAPDFTPLMEQGHAPKEIQTAFISHAHFDHIGFLPRMFEQCGAVPIYTSELSAELGQTLLRDSLNIRQMPRQLDRYIEEVTTAFAGLHRIRFARSMDFGSYRATFYEAGHIPGAAMIYLETEQGSILYTGDFSMERTSLTNGTILPEDLKADLVILDGTYAKRPGYHPNRLSDRALQSLASAQWSPISLRVNRATKGVEVLNSLAVQMEKGELPRMRIYADESVWETVQAFLRAGLPVLNENCYPLPIGTGLPPEKAICIVTRSPGYALPEYPIDFSLHAGFDELCSFIRMHARRDVAVVHAPAGRDAYGFYSLQNACGSKYHFIYPENGEIYQL